MELLRIGQMSKGFKERRDEGRWVEVAAAPAETGSLYKIHRDKFTVVVGVSAFCKGGKKLCLVHSNQPPS